MKTHKLSEEDKKEVQVMMEVMMRMNDRNDRNANQPGVFGHLWEAIATFVENQTGMDIRNEDWNYGGNATFADDVQAAIDSRAEREARK
jgi:hypothetical protein